jgi:hypothetical protein
VMRMFRAERKKVVKRFFDNLNSCFSPTRLPYFLKTQDLQEKHFFHSNLFIIHIKAINGLIIFQATHRHGIMFSFSLGAALEHCTHPKVVHQRGIIASATCVIYLILSIALIIHFTICWLPRALAYFVWRSKTSSSAQCRKFPISSSRGHMPARWTNATTRSRIRRCSPGGCTYTICLR